VINDEKLSIAHSPLFEFELKKEKNNIKREKLVTSENFVSFSSLSGQQYLFALKC